jgi:hypothetical protein
MARGACTFRQRDVTRAIKAMAAAGVDIAQVRVEIGKEGEVIITVNASDTSEQGREANEWDSV